MLADDNDFDDAAEMAADEAREHRRYDDPIVPDPDREVEIDDEEGPDDENFWIASGWS